MSKPKIIAIDGVEYVRKEDAISLAPLVEGLEYCVVRCYSAGVHIGYVKEFAKDYPQQAILLKSRRLHQWEKAASLSQVAMEGVGSSSLIAMELPMITLTDVIEVIPCSDVAAKFFQGAAPWKK